MSYYNTQNNAQQNPAGTQQQQQTQSQFGSQGPTPAQSSDFQNWMTPQKKRPQQVQQGSTNPQQQQTQQQQPQQGWQPVSAVTSNGQVNRTPLTFQQRSGPITAPVSSVQQAKAGGAPTDINSAHATINNAFSQVHGRAPTPQELNEWGAALLHGGQTPEMMMNNISQLPGAMQQFNPMSVPGNAQYNPSMFSQYAPQQNPYAQDIQNVWGNLVQQPMGLPVEQMKAQQAEVANELYQQNAGSMMQNAAASGRINGGNAQRMQQLANADRSQQVMDSYRDIDIKDFLARQDQGIGLAELGNTLANSEQDRNIADYNTILHGQGMQDDAYRFGAGFGADTWKQLTNNQNQTRAQDLQDFVAKSGTNLDWQQFGHGQQQDKFSNIFDIMSFLEGQRQFNVGSDLDRSRLDLSKNNSALQAALQGRGQDIDLLSFFMGG